MAGSAELSRAISKVGVGEELSPEEPAQYSCFVRSMLYDVQEAFLLHREGRLEEEYWGTRQAIFAAYMRTPLAVEVYERDKSLEILHDEFVEWADTKLAADDAGSDA